MRARQLSLALPRWNDLSLEQPPMTLAHRETRKTRKDDSVVHPRMIALLDRFRVNNVIKISLLFQRS